MLDEEQIIELLEYGKPIHPLPTLTVGLFWLVWRNI